MMVGSIISDFGMVGEIIPEWFREAK